VRATELAVDLDQHLPGIAGGESAAFARWLAGAEGRLRDSLRSFASRVDTEAVLQEALLRVWQVAPRVTPDGKPDALVRLGVRIARNLAVSEVRRDRLEPVDLEALERAAAIDGDAPMPDRVADAILRELIEACRGKLPRQPAAALAARLANGGGDPDAVLADRLRMRLNTFLQNVTRARRLLADCLRRRGVDVAMERS